MKSVNYFALLKPFKPNQFSKMLVMLVVYIGIIYLVFDQYINWSSYWTLLGQGSDYVKYKPALYQFELPFIVVCLLLLFFPQIKNYWLMLFLPLAILLILYALFDGFYNYLGRSPFPSDFQNFDSIIAFSPMMGIAIILIFMTIPSIVVYLFYKAYTTKNWQQNKWDLLARVFFLMMLILGLNSQQIINYHQQAFNYIVWSQEDTIRENGKFSSFYYYFNEEKQNNIKLEKLIQANLLQANKNDSLYQSNDVNKANKAKLLFPGKINQKRNVHIVVMESFIDPRKLENITFSQSVLAKALVPYLNQEETFSLIESPIYGGGTAQAEFEVLTGVPALSLVNKIEFNVMQGGKINGFVEQLKSNGYFSSAHIATGTGFFNSKQAYKSMGFNQVTYLETLPQFVEQAAKAPLFDGDVFDYNIKQVKALLNNQKQPILNYVLGMYGHLPFRRDLDKRPDVAVVEHVDERVPKIANQFYYRTQALGNYLQQLMTIDPNSLILVFSDHLPSILGADTQYQLNNKINIALFYDNQKNIDITGKKLFQLPWLIWDQLLPMNTTTERNFTEQQLEDFYYQTLIESKDVN